MPAQRDVRLPEWQRLATGDADQFLHDVDASRHLGHAVFDLDARVHLEEVVLAVRREQALDVPAPR